MTKFASIEIAVIGVDIGKTRSALSVSMRRARSSCTRWVREMWDWAANDFELFEQRSARPQR